MEDGLLLAVGGVVIDVSGVGDPEPDHRADAGEDEQGGQYAHVDLPLGEVVVGEGAEVGLLLLFHEVGDLLRIDVQLLGEARLHRGIGAKQVARDPGEY